MSGEDDLRPLPWLACMLARGDYRPAANPQCTFETALCSAFNLQAPVGHDLPVAALTAVSDLTLRPEGVWARVDPVNLRPDMAKLLLFAEDHLPLSHGEALAITQRLTAELALEGLRIQTGTVPSRWYMPLTDPVPRLQTRPPYTVHGQHIDPYLPTGPDASTWNRHVNTIQMLLHMEPVNDQRERDGLLPINSVWLWGVGALPTPVDVPWTDVVTNDPLAHGLALVNGCKVHPLPPSVEQLELHAMPYLLVQPVALHGKQWRQGNAAWQAQWSALEQHWLKPLQSLLQRGKIQQLTLLTEQATVSVTRSNLRRFWRRSKPLEQQLLAPDRN